ncbi:hypothetical protein RhiirC2_778369 [Rhizophagus irregularis]|uniref:Uncharacterized protein n=1 Tax=Rhizophagus irregularis TaxID=588596 RepID=A0A2N1NC36_9GLOM|nr:hypothetical protein RhiirC2_778369 [Rhizophagus irregularis]
MRRHPMLLQISPYRFADLIIDSIEEYKLVKFIKSIDYYSEYFECINGSRNKLSIENMIHNEIENKIIIKAIYQNCSNLIYLKLLLISENILELEQLLINCQYLIGLYFINKNIFDWDKLFEILFKYKFNKSIKLIKLESLILFINNWKGRHLMLLQLDLHASTDLFDLIEEFKSEGIIKKFDYLHSEFKDFEW